MKSTSHENTYKDLLNTLSDGKRAVIVTSIDYRYMDKDTKLNTTLITEEDLYNNIVNEDDNLYKKGYQALETGDLLFENSTDNGTLIIEPYFPEPKLVIFGGGHIAKPLVEFAAKVGFSITVVDDRPSFANKGRFPEAKNVICESFENCFNQLNLNASTFVVIITRGHRHDMHCLKQTLKYNTAYVGMIGSKRRIKVVKEQLLEEGYSQEMLGRVCAPIGLEINAVTPEEIAISIAAQLISYRRSKITKSGSLLPSKANWPEFERVVVEELAKDLKEPKAVVTIVSTKGSVPRKEGAKMIVYPDGRILGSIGGGCSEGEVIITAWDVIKTGVCKIQHVDMTGQVAEEEGMVCGGIMEVFIEPNYL